MECTNCGTRLLAGSVFNTPTCRKCAIRITIKDFLLNVVLTFLAAYILFKYAGMVFEGSLNQTIFTIMLVGIPFGAKKMFAWIIPFGHEIAATIALLLLNVFVGALIGWAVLAWRISTTIIKTVYRVFRLVTFKPHKIPDIEFDPVI